MTNQLSLQQQCSRLYKRIERQLAGYGSTATDEKKWIEWGFCITTKAWLAIEETVNSYRFADQQEEIIFYKMLKPKFIGLMNFFTLLYKLVLFQPDDTPGRKELWKNELTSCRNYLWKHRSFCRYYEEGNTTMDLIYFVQQNNEQPLVFGINENNLRNSTSYSDLLARVISIQKYQHYVSEKLSDKGYNHFPNHANIICSCSGVTLCGVLGAT
jgi:hypothetical protein